MKLITPDKTLARLENDIKKKTIKAKPPILRVILGLEPTPDECAYLKSILATAIKLRVGIETEYIDFGETQKVHLLLSHTSGIDGVIVLSKNCSQELLDSIVPKRDIDCMSSASFAKLITDTSPDRYLYAPCTPIACYELLKDTCGSLEGKSIAVIGRSLTVGKPLAEILCQANAKVTMLHSKCSYDLSQYEIIISAIGQAEKIGLKDFSETPKGQYLIDVGMNTNSAGKLCGDFNIAEFEDKDVYITPVPGCIGKISTMVLFRKLFANAGY